MPERHQNGIYQSDWPWRTGGTQVDFLTKVRHHGIPPHLLDILWTVMAKDPKANVVQLKLNDLFASPPTFEEFRRAISSRPGKTAGGITELTYSMMKSWSLPFKKLVYDNLAAL